MKWIKFKDILPGPKQDVWVSDGDIVWICCYTQMYSRGTGSVTYWMPIIQPDPPEKEKHRCHNLEGDSIHDCYEHECGQLYLEARSIFGRITPYPVKFCPYCGFTLEKK